MPLTVFQSKEGELTLTQDAINAFNRDGVVLIKNILSKNEVDKLLKQIEQPNGITASAWESPDGLNNKTKRVIWNEPGNDVTGIVARSQKIAGTAEKLLGGEVYHYHGKVMLKEARTGGQHHWHQDYGYWYYNGVLKPDMLTAYIALDKCRVENGCLQVLLGSHLCGRIDHMYEKDTNQTVADRERVKQLQGHLELVCVELDPGDCVFFHCNILHMAGQNNSDLRRYCYLCAYNRADNNPVYKHHHPFYTPLHKVPDTAIMECTETDISGKDFLKYTPYTHDKTH